MERKMVNALMVAPRMPPCKIQLYLDKKFLRSAVSVGLWERTDDLYFFRLEKDVGILYARCAALWNGQINRRINGKIFAGTFYIVGIQDRELVSLPPDAIAKYREKLWKPLHLTDKEDVDCLLAHIDALFSDAEVL